jgi:hypothetical protein
MHGLSYPGIDFLFHLVNPLFAETGKNFHLHECLLMLMSARAILPAAGTILEILPGQPSDLRQYRAAAS